MRIDREHESGHAVEEVDVESRFVGIAGLRPGVGAPGRDAKEEDEESLAREADVGVCVAEGGDGGIVLEDAEEFGGHFEIGCIDQYQFGQLDTWGIKSHLEDSDGHGLRSQSPWSGQCLVRDRWRRDMERTNPCRWR